MKYFTPERYAAFQVEEYNAATYDDWEEQTRLYQERERQIADTLPVMVKLFEKTCQLHDARFDPCFFGPLSPTPPAVQLVIRQKNWGNYLCVLRYKLAPPGFVAQLAGHQEALRAVYHQQECFHPGEKSRPDYWLYDEWDYLGKAKGVDAEADLFSHQILLTSGRELRLVFTEFEFLYFPFGEGCVEG